jgi:2-amino-4-hydroxy-6-hydroxymethyldihydropteridine diphosphokinase
VDTTAPQDPALWIPVYVGLGSNLEDPVAQLRRALDALAAFPATRLCAVSRFYGNPPMGGLEQPPFVNAVAALLTTLSPEALHDQLLAVEAAQGRRRTPGERWPARTLDLDLLVYGRRQIRTPRLTVPHPGIPGRNFVLFPLREIAPGLDVPGLGPVSGLCARADTEGLEALP